WARSFWTERTRASMTWGDTVVVGAGIDVEVVLGVGPPGFGPGPWPGVVGNGRRVVVVGGTVVVVVVATTGFRPSAEVAAGGAAGTAYAGAADALVMPANTVVVSSTTATA
ncbi:MAG: hypothetical protein QOF81_2805, partial [Acidimicrobiaceae bacterium]|nr:hypothetical protein [Acidimicrobiaceae bacterium]